MSGNKKILENLPTKEMADLTKVSLGSVVAADGIRRFKDGMKIKEDEGRSVKTAIVGAGEVFLGATAVASGVIGTLTEDQTLTSTLTDMYNAATKTILSRSSS